MNQTTTPYETHRSPETEYLVTDKRIAEHLCISVRHVHTLRSQGILRAVKLGSSLRFPIRENMQRILTLGNPERR